MNIIHIMIWWLIPKSLMLANYVTLLRFTWPVNVVWVHNKLFSIFVFYFLKIQLFYFWTQFRICLFVLIFPAVRCEPSIQVCWEEDLESHLSLKPYKYIQYSTSVRWAWWSFALVWMNVWNVWVVEKTLNTHLNEVET